MLTTRIPARAETGREVPYQQRMVIANKDGTKSATILHTVNPKPLPSSPPTQAFPAATAPSTQPNPKYHHERRSSSPSSHSHSPDMTSTGTSMAAHPPSMHPKQQKNRKKKRMGQHDHDHDHDAHQTSSTPPSNPMPPPPPPASVLAASSSSSRLPHPKPQANGHPPRPPSTLPSDDDGDGDLGHSGKKKKSKKKKKSLSVIDNLPPPPPKAAADIWFKSDAEEKQRIREFWLQLGEEERRALVKLEKEAVLRKMKEQQKQTCSCSVCGRKRTVIEEELEILYDAYYEELEHFAHDQARGQDPAHIKHPHPSQQQHLTHNHHHSHPNHHHHHHHHHSSYHHSHGHRPSSRNSYDSEDDDEDDDEGDDSNHSGNGSIFEFGSSLTVKEGGILTVADDFLKNDGRKFLDLMEQLAERKIRLLEEEDSNGSGGGGNQDWDDTYEDDDDEDYDDEEDSMTEEQRMEEGRRMFQIFAAKMFEQRVLQAYREKVSQERQLRLLQELEEEKQLLDQKEEAKQKVKEKKKEKKKAVKQQKEEEKLAKERERIAEEERIRAAKEKRTEEERLRREAEKTKKEEERLKREETERLKREAERLKKEEEKRKQREAEERKQKAKEEKERADREKKEREAKAKEAAEKDAAEKKAAAAAAADAERRRKEEDRLAAQKQQQLHQQQQQQAKLAAAAKLAAQAPSTPASTSSQPQVPVKQIQILQNPRNASAKNVQPQPSSGKPVQIPPPGFGTIPPAAPPGIAVARPISSQQQQPQPAPARTVPPVTSPVKSPVDSQKHPHPQQIPLQFPPSLSATNDVSQSPHPHYHPSLPSSIAMGAPIPAMFTNTGLPALGWGPIVDGNPMMRPPQMPYPHHIGPQQHLGPNPALNSQQMMGMGLPAGGPFAANPMGLGPSQPINQGKPLANAPQGPQTAVGNGTNTASSSGVVSPPQMHGTGFSLGGVPSDHVDSTSTAQTGSSNTTSALSAGIIGSNVAPIGFGKPNPIGRPGAGPIGPSTSLMPPSNVVMGGGATSSVGPTYTGPFGPSAVFGGFGPLDHTLSTSFNGNVGNGHAGRGADLFAAEPWRIPGGPISASPGNNIGPIGPPSTLPSKGSGLISMLDYRPDVGAVGSKPQLSPPVPGSVIASATTAGAPGAGRTGQDPRMPPGPIGPPGGLHSHLPPGITPATSNVNGPTPIGLSHPYQHNPYHHHLQLGPQPGAQAQAIGFQQYPGPSLQPMISSAVGGAAGSAVGVGGAGGRLYDIWDSPMPADNSGHRAFGAFAGSNYLPQHSHSIFAPGLQTSGSTQTAASAAVAPGAIKPPSPSLTSSKPPAAVAVVSPSSMANLPVSAGAGGSANGAEFGWF